MNYEDNLMLWSESPEYWVSIFFIIGYVSMVMHELGHALTAHLIGAKVTQLNFGKPVFPVPLRISSVKIYLGLPLGGRCYYEWINVNNTTPWRSAIVQVGGWIADATFLIFVVASGSTNNNSIAYMLYLYLWVKVIFGITPITGDGRALLSDLKMGLQNPIFHNKGH